MRHSLSEMHKQLIESAARLHAALQEAPPIQNPVIDEPHDPFGEDAEDIVPHHVRETTEELESHIERLEEQAKAMEAQDHDSRCASWKAWVEAALAGGAKQAHKFVKGPQPWIPKSTNITGA